MEIKQVKLGMVNAYLVKAVGGNFLIDTGIAMSRKKLLKSIGREGVSPADIRLVIVTHGDIDHIGNCAFLQKKYGLKIAIHEADATLCRTGKMIAGRKRKVKQNFFRKALFAMIVGPMMKKYPPETFEPDVVFTGDRDLKEFGLDAKVVTIPGHTMGSIGVLTADGDFFSGDTINNRKKPVIGEIVENETALQASAEKILKMKIRSVYPGHGTPFSMKDFHFE